MISSISSLAMDAYVTCKSQKKTTPLTLHDEEIKRLRNFVSEGRNVFVCGGTGTGKTFVIESVLDSSNCVEILPGNIPKTLFTNSKSYTLIDGYDSSTKHLVDEKARRLVVTSTEVHIIPNFELIMMPRRSPELITTLAPDSYEAAKRCNGNIRNFFDYLDNSDDKDVFKTSKEVVRDILCSPGSFDLSQTVFEHGYTCDAIHGNYLSTNSDSYADIIDSLSMADVYDTNMYNGNWELMPYYVVSGIAIPKYHMQSNIEENTIKPGSSWTKYGNYKMRQQKLKNIQNKHSTQLGVEELAVIRKYAAAGDIGPAVAYKLNPSDFDVMNHLAISNKLRPNEIIHIKNKLRNVNNEF